MTRLTRPTSVGAVLATVLALVLGGIYSWTGLLLGGVGSIVLVAGLHRGTDRFLGMGAFGLFLGTAFGGIDGAPPLTLLVAVACSVLAWDLGGYAIGIERQLGATASTARTEIVHIAGSVAVGLVTIGAGYGMYMAGSGGQPLSALFFLLVAAFLLIAALR